jgi:hypothetical protein
MSVRDLLFQENLVSSNNERNTRESTKSAVVGKGRGMSFEAGIKHGRKGRKTSTWWQDEEAG